MLTAAYHMLGNGTFYQDPGADHFDTRNPEKQLNRLLKRITDLGFDVEIRPGTATA